MATTKEDSVSVTFDPTAINKQSDIIPGATANSAGVMTAQQFAALASVTAKDNVFIFVNSDTGDDNNPGTSARPVKTLDKALSLVPLSWTKQCKIFVSGVAPVTLNPPGINLTLGKGVGENFSPLAIIGDFTTVLSGTVPAGEGDPSGKTVKDSNLPPLVVDAYRGAFISMTSGANVGQRHLIISNTVDTFVVNETFFGPVADGDTFIVERPAVTIEHSIDVEFFNCGVIGFKALKFVSLGGSAFTAAGDSFFVLEGVEFDLSSGFGIGAFDAGGAWHAGSEDLLWLNDGAENPFSFLRFGAGVYAHNGRYDFAKNTEASGYYVWDSMRTGGGSYTFHNLPSLSARSSSYFSGVMCRFVTFSSDWDGSIGPSSRPPFTFGFKSFGQLGFGVVIQNSPSDAIRVREGSLLITGDVSGSGTTPGYGIACDRMAQARVSQANQGGATTVTGASGDTLVGATPKAYGALPFSEVDGSGPTLNRIEL